MVVDQPTFGVLVGAVPAAAADGPVRCDGTPLGAAALPVALPLVLHLHGHHGRAGGHLEGGQFGVGVGAAVDGVAPVLVDFRGALQCHAYGDVVDHVGSSSIISTL